MLDANHGNTELPTKNQTIIMSDNVPLHNLVDRYQHFEGTCCLHLYGRRVSKVGKCRYSNRNWGLRVSQWMIVALKMTPFCHFQKEISYKLEWDTGIYIPMMCNAQNECHTSEFSDKPRNVGRVSTCFTCVKRCTPIEYTYFSNILFFKVYAINISLMKQQFVVTQTIPQTEIPTLLDS